MDKVKITWNGQGGELDSATVKDDGEGAIRDALIKMLQRDGGGIVAPGDSFTVEVVK